MPPEDEAEGRAIPVGPYHQAVQQGLAYDLSDKFVVHWSKKRPDNAFVSVEYNGKWFYIDDRDYHSKVFFAGFTTCSISKFVPSSASQGPLLTVAGQLAGRVGARIGQTYGRTVDF